MNFTILLSPWFWLALAVAAAGALGKAWDDERQAFASYRGGVDALGKAQEERTRDRIALDKARKETADAQLTSTTAAWAAALDRVRRQAGPVASIVPPAPAGASKPDRACFDRAILDRGLRGAMEEFRSAARGIVEKGDGARLRLDNALRWAGGSP